MEKPAPVILRAPHLAPHSPQELAEALVSAASRNNLIALGGAFSKHLMAGPAVPPDIILSSSNLTRVLQYEPRDLTISVEAGMRYADLSRLVAQHRQMIPLDPPFSGTATIGGIVASNTSGPRRRLYGTARDLVIGMQFATLDGKLIQSGGMVVKNVAGLDMGKLMIGSFGTLAAITVVNFKLLPRPAAETTFLLTFEKLSEAAAARDQILKGAIQPAAMDLLNPLAAAQIGHKGYLMAVQIAGNAAVVARARREFRAGSTVVLEGIEASRFWRQVEEFTPHFLDKFAHGAVVRISCGLSQVKDVVASLETAVIARAGSGVSYGYFSRTESAAHWMAAAAGRGWKTVIEFAPDEERARLDLWPTPGSDFEMMKKVKRMFDPNHLLNRGRLYRLI